MDVSSIKTVSWIVSAGLSLGLGYTVWDYVDRDSGRRRVDADGRESLVVVEPEYVRAVLESDVRLEVDVKHGLNYKDQVQPTFLLMNWTGYEKPAPVVVDPGPASPKAPRYKPIAQVLRVLMIAVDSEDPGGSFAFAQSLPAGLPIKLHLGDTLPKPNDFAVVHSIRVEGVEFAFKQEGRDNETIAPTQVDDGNLIATGGNGAARGTGTAAIPQVQKRASKRPAQTQMIGNNNFVLGTEDMNYFGENYAEILTNEVTTRTRYDAEGNRSGIEIQRVAAGSVAARHGAQEGDVLISINGKAVSSEQEAIAFVKNNQDKYSAWEVVVERLGRRETIVYTD